MNDTKIHIHANTFNMMKYLRSKPTEGCFITKRNYHDDTRRWAPVDCDLIKTMLGEEVYGNIIGTITYKFEKHDEYENIKMVMHNK